MDASGKAGGRRKDGKLRLPSSSGSHIDWLSGAALTFRFVTGFGRNCLAWVFLEGTLR